MTARSRVSFPLLLLLLLAASHAAGQGIARKMDDLFDSMSNVTLPGAVEGQTRGVLTGGSAQVRFGTTGIQVAGFTPPSITAGGCGGFDAYGGSFSFVNKDEFVNFGRRVAANAAGYMFHLALSNLCSSCEAKMAWLQDTVDSLNKHFQNSCEAAQLAVDRTVGPAIASLTQGARAQLVTSGAADDYAAAAHTGPGGPSEAAQLAQRDPQAGAALIPGNVLYRAMREAGLAGWFDASDPDSFYQDLMSLTGTVIVCVPGVSGCRAPETQVGDQQGAPVAFPLRGTVTFRDLIYGAASGPLTFLRCSGECMDPQPVVVADYKGMADRVIELMSGTQGAYGPNGGLIGKLARNLGAYTAQEQAFLSGLGNYTAKALRLARTDEAAAHSFVRTFAPELAAELLATYIQRAVAQAVTAVDLRGTDSTGAMRDMLAQVQADIRAERAAIAASLAGEAQLMAYVDILLRQSDAPVIPPRASTIAGSE